MRSWLDSDIEDLTALVDDYCFNHECSECPFIQKTMDCLNDITNRLNRTHDLINKYKKELSQYV